MSRSIQLVYVEREVADAARSRRILARLPRPALFSAVFGALAGIEIHSVSFGPFRLPRDFYRRMSRLYPDEPLFAGALDEGSIVSYGEAREREMLDFCRRELARFVPPERLYPCAPPRGAAASS